MVLALIISNGIISLPLSLPVYKPDRMAEYGRRMGQWGLDVMFKWEDGKVHELPQDFADMLGWKELGKLVDKAFEKVDKDELTLVQCDNYGEAGAVNFYSQNKTGEDLTIDADYMYWYPLDEGEIVNVILVKGPWDEDPERTRERDLVDSVQQIGEITHPYAREKGTKVYLLKGAKVSVNDILREEIEKRIAGEK